MAAPPPTAHSFRPDPFWASAAPAPSMPHQEVEQSSAAQQITPQPTNTTPPPPKNLIVRSSARTPTCTHITMDRSYGEHTCQICGKVPSIGWLYSCQEDHLPPSQHLITDTEVLPAISDEDDYFEAQAKTAEAIGMSKSIIAQMRQGDYTFDQIEILLDQRRHVLDVLRKVEHGSEHNTPSLAQAPLPSESIIASVGTSAAPAVQQHFNDRLLLISPAGIPMNVPLPTTMRKPNKQKVMPKQNTCSYQVCHACRPFLYERVPVGLGPVLNNEVPAVTDKEMARLPMYHPDIIRNLGLRLPRLQTKLFSSRDITELHAGDGHGDAQEDDWTPTTNNSFDSDESDSNSDEYPCPGSGICPVADASGICAYDTGFNDGNRAFFHSIHARSYQQTKPPTEPSTEPLTESSTAPSTEPSTPNDRVVDLLARSGTASRSTPSSAGSSVSLPEHSTPVTPTASTGLGLTLGIVDKNDDMDRPHTSLGFFNQRSKSRQRSSSMESKYSNDSVGSEVEVEGGVALTEEAVGNRTPDIASVEEEDDGE